MPSPPALSFEDYDAIASAVMETERGRWFLAEFARRNRSADTAAVLEALAAVETRLSARSGAEPENARRPGVEAAARRITGALDASARIRARLLGATDAAATDRALAEIGGVETDLKAALEALGAPRAAELTALAAPPLAPEEPEPVAETAPVRQVAIVAAPEPAPQPKPAPVSVQAPAPVAQRSEPVVEVPTPSPAVNAIVEERSEPVAVARPQPVPVREKPLLDRLSAAEKAILFA